MLHPWVRPRRQILTSSLGNSGQNAADDTTLESSVVPPFAAISPDDDTSVLTADTAAPDAAAAQALVTSLDDATIDGSDKSGGSSLAFRFLESFGSLCPHLSYVLSVRSTACCHPHRRCTAVLRMDGSKVCLPKGSSVWEARHTGVLPSDQALLFQYCMWNRAASLRCRCCNPTVPRMGRTTVTCYRNTVFLQCCI